MPPLAGRQCSGLFTVVRISLRVRYIGGYIGIIGII